MAGASEAAVPACWILARLVCALSGEAVAASADGKALCEVRCVLCCAGNGQGTASALDNLRFAAKEPPLRIAALIRAGVPANGMQPSAL